jgi:hypothetical protein
MMVGLEKAQTASKEKVLDDRVFVFCTRANYYQQKGNQMVLEA